MPSGSTPLRVRVRGRVRVMVMVGVRARVRARVEVRVEVGHKARVRISVGRRAGRLFLTLTLTLTLARGPQAGRLPVGQVPAERAPGGQVQAAQRHLVLEARCIYTHIYIPPPPTGLGVRRTAPRPFR